jgi:RNA polymerase primary sigma factor
MEASDPSRLPEPVEELVARHDDEGCVNLSELEGVLAELHLDDDEVAGVHEQLEARGVEVTDDCGRADVPDTTYSNSEMAVRTTDAMRLFLNEAGRYPLLTADEELDLARRIERGDLEAKDKLVNHNLRLVVSIARK